MKYAAIVMAFCVATPAFAQDRMDLDECAQSWAALFSLTNLPPTTISADVDPSGWCVIENATLDANARLNLQVDSLRWRASEIERFLDDGLPPRSIEIYGEGVRTQPKTGDPVYDYLLGLQKSGQQMGFGISARWDGVQNAVYLDEGYITFDDTNKIEATGQLDGVDLTDMESFQSSIANMGLRSLQLKTTFDGWFETILALPIGVGILTDPALAPEDQVIAVKDRTIEFTSDLPDQILPDVAKEALAEFVTDLPNPRGELQVQLQADPVIGADQIGLFQLAKDAQTRAEMIPQVLDGLRVLVTWTSAKE